MLFCFVLCFVLVFLCLFVGSSVLFWCWVYFSLVLVFWDWFSLFGLSVRFLVRVGVLCFCLVGCTSVSAFFLGLFLLFFCLMFVIGLDNIVSLKFRVGDIVCILWLVSFVGRVRVVCLGMFVCFFVGFCVLYEYGLTFLGMSVILWRYVMFYSYFSCIC